MKQFWPDTGLRRNDAIAAPSSFPTGNFPTPGLQPPRDAAAASLMKAAGKPEGLLIEELYRLPVVPAPLDPFLSQRL